MSESNRIGAAMAFGGRRLLPPLGATGKRTMARGHLFLLRMPAEHLDVVHQVPDKRSHLPFARPGEHVQV